MSLTKQQWFSHVSRPSRYLGNEFNSARKDPGQVEISIALAFPDVYEVGMSHLGLKILYSILNHHPWLAAERVFAPWTDLEKEMRRHRTPLTTLESHRELACFDIIGFSLQHELGYTNVLNMLDLAGLDLFASDRSEQDPLVIAGGPACFNPEPVAEFFDAIVIGDGEEAALEICRLVREKKQGRIRNKEQLLHQLRCVPGVYIPSFFSIHYNADGSIAAIDPRVKDYSSIRKAIVPHIDQYSYPTEQIVPFAELVHDRLAIEISRGCTRGCRFCQAGMIYRPVRERSPDSVLAVSKAALKKTGYEDLSLLSLSTGDYGCIEPLLSVLMDRHSRDKIAVSLPSLRVDSLSPGMIEQIKRVRKTGFTLAAEAGNDRLRRVINKGLTQNDILNIAQIVYGAGWNLIKLYFMVGLPFEEEDDVWDIVTLARKVAGLAGRRARKSRLNVSISTFVPKSHTPFMWMPQISMDESRKRIQKIRKELGGGRIHVKWNQPEMSWLEGIFSRGDRRLSRVIAAAWKLGARFDAWGDQFQMEIWQQALASCSLNAHDYLYRQRSHHEILPWNHIHSGVSPDFFQQELEKAKKGLPTPDCRKQCLNCGVCDHETIDPVIFAASDFHPETLPPPGWAAFSPASTRYQIIFTKTGLAGYLSHLELVRTFIRAFKRAELDLVYSRGYHPMPKLSFTCALPVGVESMEEMLEIELRGAPDSSFLESAINQQLPSGIAVTSVKKVLGPKRRAVLKESYFFISFGGVEAKEEELEAFLKSEHFFVVKTTKKGEHQIDARPLVKFISLRSSNEIELVLRHTEGPQLKPDEIIKNIFPSVKQHACDIKVMKTKQILSKQ